MAACAVTWGLSSMFKGLAAGIAVALVSGAAAAHTGDGAHAHSLAAGFAHPFTGIDHLLVMLAVGVYAVRATARAWLLPALFVAFMLVGGGLGAYGVPVAYAEEGILASVAIMAVLALAAPRIPLLAVAPMVAAFAVLHGFAHGAEMAVDGSFLGYATGFALATALLHAAGVGLGAVARGRFAALRRA